MEKEKKEKKETKETKKEKKVAVVKEDKVAKKTVAKKKAGETKADVKKTTKKVVAKKAPKKADEKVEKKETKKDSKKDKDVLKRTFGITVPNSEIEKSIDEIAEKYSADMKLSGFRKGKVPAELLKSRYKGALSEEALNKIVEEYVFKKIEKDKIRIVAQPSIDNVNHKEGKDLTADVTVEVYPEFDLPDLETIEAEVSAEELKIDEYDEKKQINLVLQSRRRLITINNRAIKDGDIVLFNIQTKILKTKRMSPRIEESIDMIKDNTYRVKDMYDELKGKKVGDKLSIEREYPADYKKKKWAGEKVEHIIEITRIQNYFTPELSENTIKELGFKDEKTLKEKLKEEYDTHVKRHLDDVKNTKRIEKLIKSVEFPIPESLVLQEIDRMKNDPQTATEVLDEKTIKEKAIDFVKYSLIYFEVQKKYKIEATSDDIEAELKKMADLYQLPIKEMRKYYSNAKQQATLKDRILGDKVAELLQEKIKIKEIK